MIFLDTSFLVSFYNVRDYNHAKAATIMREILAGRHGSPIISDYVFDECATVIFARLKSLQKTVSVCDDVRKLAAMIRVDEASFDLAWEKFSAQSQTALSFTDCTSIAIAERHGLANIATFDAGFRKVSSVKVIG